MEEGRVFEKGDHVVYFPTGSESNPSSGVIKQILRDDEAAVPRYLIENDRTHKETAYYLENIVEKVREGGYGEEIEETTQKEDVGEIYNE